MSKNSPFSSPIAKLVFEWCRFDTSIKWSEITESIYDILNFATRNGVAPWCYYQYQKQKISSLPDQLEQPLKMQYLQTLLMNRQKWKVFQDINTISQQHNIPIIPLKGIALAFTLYPQEALRPMGDIDILVPEDKINSFQEIMLKHGATTLCPPLSGYHAKINAHIPAMLWQNIMIEPHQRLFALGNSFNPQNTDLFKETISPSNNLEITVLNDVLQAYHLAAHIFKGYKLGCMRLSWLLDLALILQRNIKDSDFFQKIININPKVQRQISSVIYWSSLLLPHHPWNIKHNIPFPDEMMFHKERNTSQKHRLMVFNDIIKLPGLHHKTLLLFREFFPEKAYMDHQYGKHRGFSLLLLYFKRILGL